MIRKPARQRREHDERIIDRTVNTMQDHTEQRGGMNERKRRNGTDSVYSSQHFNSSVCRKIYALTNRAVIKATTMNDREGNRMFSNLKKALDAKGITIRSYAKVLGVDERTIQNKIREKTPFTYDEAIITKKELLPEYDMEYLFTRK